MSSTSKPHLHAAIGGLQRLLRQVEAGCVGMPDVGLHVEAARGEPRALHAKHEGLRALDHEPKAGLAGMLRFVR